MVWAVASVFTIQSSIVLLAVGCVIWLFLGPYAEAAEHTTLQKVVPYERQGRVFGFAQSVEQSAAPLTAFLIGDRKSTRLNSSHYCASRVPSSARTKKRD